MAYALAVLSALANAVTTILQRMGVETAPPEDRLHWSLIAHAIHRRVWLIGIALMVGSFFLQATALSLGRLTIVQPIITLELPFLVAILSVYFGHRLGWREWGGALGGALGLATFFAVASPQGGNEVPGGRAWIVAGILGVLGVALTTALGRVGAPAFRSAMFGSSAAICYAFTAAFTKEVTEELHVIWYEPALHWPFYAMIVGGLLGVFLTQNAFHAGPVTASQSTLTIVDPLVSIGLGVGLFGDQLRNSPTRILIEGVALVVVFSAVVVLAASPLVVSVKSEDDDKPHVLGHQRQLVVERRREAPTLERRHHRRRPMLDRGRHRDDPGPVAGASRWQPRGGNDGM